MLKRALGFDVIGKRKQGQLKITWRREVEEELKKLELKKKDVIDKKMRHNAVYEIFWDMR